jgi:hypothetical protein
MPCAANNAVSQKEIGNSAKVRFVPGFGVFALAAARVACIIRLS